MLQEIIGFQYCAESVILKISETTPSFPHHQRAEVIICLDNVLDGPSHSCDDTVDDMDHTICGHLVTMDDSGTVHRHNLRARIIIFYLYAHNLSVYIYLEYNTLDVNAAQMWHLPR